MIDDAFSHCLLINVCSHKWMDLSQFLNMKHHAKLQTRPMLIMIVTFICMLQMLSLKCLCSGFVLRQPMSGPYSQSVLQETAISQLYSSMEDSNSQGEDDFMKALKSRINEVNDRDTKIPIVVLDSMLPRQVLRIESDNPIFMDLVRSLVAQENPAFGMVGTAHLTSGQQLPLQNGVEVQIVGSPHLVETGLRCELRAGRRMRIVGELSTCPDGGWTEARVRYFDSQEEEEEEANDEDDTTKKSTISLTRAISRARELTSPNMSMPDNKSLVDRWIELARENERMEGQIDKLLEDLEEIPPPEEPTERAMWVGALVNPLPGMGVAMEIRPALLMARTAEERVEVALNGLLASIRHMDGTAPLF